MELKVIAPILSFLVVISSSTNLIGKLCVKNSECGRNEFCKFPRIFDPPCSKGTCQCQACFANATSIAPCLPKTIERPCDLKCLNGTAPFEECDDWCEKDSSLTMLAPNTQCKHFNRGKYSRRVVCDDCYLSDNRHCVPKVNKNFKSECTESCQCDSNLKCNGKCMCLTTNEHWDSDLLTCVRRELGDDCYFDRDCDVNPLDENFGQFYRGLACVNGKCKCAANFSTTMVTSLGERGVVVTKEICVAKTATINLSEREKCTFQNDYNGTNPNIKICAPGLLCMTCGDGNPTKICSKFHFLYCIASLN